MNLHAKANSNPPPKQKPLTLATVGKRLDIFSILSYNSHPFVTISRLA